MHIWGHRAWHQHYMGSDLSIGIKNFQFHAIWLYRNSIKILSKFYRNSIEILLKFYRNSIEILSKFYRDSMEILSKFYRNSACGEKLGHETISSAMWWVCWRPWSARARPIFKSKGKSRRFLSVPWVATHNDNPPRIRRGSAEDPPGIQQGAHFWDPMPLGNSLSRNIQWNKTA